MESKSITKMDTWKRLEITSVILKIEMILEIDILLINISLVLFLIFIQV